MATGRKTGGGSRKGRPNRATAAKAAAVAASGLTPLDYLLAEMRDESLDNHLRHDAAKAAAPYVHPRLATMTLQGDEAAPLRTINRIELIAVYPQARD
jgi:hypothetical protein